jgi:hypothetical protein
MTHSFNMIGQLCFINSTFITSYSINKTFMASYSINRTLVNLISREFRQDRKLTEGQGYGCLINVT